MGDNNALMHQQQRVENQQSKFTEWFALLT